MGIDVVTLSAAKKYTNLVALGLSNIQIDNKTGTVKFTLNDGSTATYTFPKPANGASIIDVDVNSDNTLTCTLSDGTKVITKNKITIPSGSGSGGSSQLSNAITSNVEVGGVPSGTNFVKGTKLEEIIKKMLVKYFPPTATFSITPSNTTYEIGTTVSNINFTINVTKKSNDIQSIKIYDGSTLLTTITSGVASGGTFTYSYTCNMTSNTTLKVEVSDGTSTVSATKNLSFVSPYYHGVSSNDLSSITSTDILAMTKDVAVKGNKNYKFTCNNEYCVIAYPKSYGSLASILDSNNFENIYSFNCVDITINSTLYTVYQTNTKVTCTDFGYKFVY